MNWNPFNKKEVSKLKAEIATLQEKSFTPQMYWLNDGRTVQLFDFNNNKQIKLALDSVPELAAPINYMSKSFSAGKYQIKLNDKIIDHKINTLLENPHPLFNESDFKQNVAKNLMAYGVAYIWANTPLMIEKTKGMFIIPSWRVQPFVDEITDKELRSAEKIETLIKYYVVETENKQIKIPTDEIMQIRQNVDVSVRNKYLTFTSPLKSLEKALLVTPAIYDSMQNLLNNGGMKGFIASDTGDNVDNIPIKDEDKLELQKQFKNYGSKSGQYDVAFTKHSLKYVQITARIKDMLLSEQREMIKTVIADILGFDNVLLNGSKSSNYGVFYKEARKSLFTETIIPLANNYTDALTNYFFEFRNNKIILDYSHLDVFSQDEKEKAEKVGIESEYIIALNKSVFAKEMTKENAISLLVLNGYNPDEAKKLIK